VVTERSVCRRVVGRNVLKQSQEKTSATPCQFRKLCILLVTISVGHCIQKNVPDVGKDMVLACSKVSLKKNIRALVTNVDCIDMTYDERWERNIVSSSS
jgi:hypothetical protein